MAHTLVVIPCYNEAARLDASRIDAFLSAAPGVGFVLVDDGSRDDTLALLRKLEASWPGRVEVLALQPNGGKAEAVRRGMLRALERGPSCAGYWDADLATPLEMIPSFQELLAERPEIDVVMGARVSLLGRAIERNPFRHYVGRVAATAISFVLGIPVYDTQCGAKLFRSEGDIPGLFADPFTTGWAFDVEILARLIRSRAESGGPAPRGCIYEYPLPAWRDVPGSKVRPADYLRAARDLWRIRRRYRVRTSSLASR